MELSQKLKSFPDFLVPILENKLNFEHFEEKDDRHICFISEITDCQRLG